MKKLWVRETLYLLLPVLLIGGGVLLKNGNLLKWSNPLDLGPRRLEIVGTKPLELTPLDVARGFDWGVVFQTRVKGEANLPANWKLNWTAYSPNVRFVYRKGKDWKPVTWPDSRNSWTVGIGEGDNPFKVNLGGLPKDTDEVRMRGYLERSEYFTGPLPTGWKPPSNLTILGSRRRLTIKTKPFDIPIKASGEAMPAPQVSQEAKIKLMDACRFTTKYVKGTGDDFYLHLRHSENQKWSTKGTHTIDNLHFFDADGNEIALFNKNGRGTPYWGGQSYMVQDQFSPNKPESDLIISLFVSEVAPRKPWDSYKQPIRVQAEVSDGTCWPTKIDTTLRHEEGTSENMKKFGAPDSK